MPMGTHNLDNAHADITMRLAQPDDQFIPLGKIAADVETPDAGEVVYAVDHEI